MEGEDIPLMFAAFLRASELFDRKKGDKKVLHVSFSIDTLAVSLNFLKLCRELSNDLSYTSVNLKLFFEKNELFFSARKL